MMSLDINNIAIITVKGENYCCIIYAVSKSDTINLIESFIIDGCGII